MMHLQCVVRQDDFKLIDRHVHTIWHRLVFDGVYRITEDGPVFQPIGAPTTELLHTLLNQSIKRIMKLLSSGTGMYRLRTYGWTRTGF